MTLPERADEFDALLLEDVLQFRGGAEWLDRYDIFPLADLLDGSAPGLRRPARISGSHALVGFDARARTWSMGELLVLAAAATARPVAGNYWSGQLLALARQAAEAWLPDPRARHSMHLAHGLASALSALRARRASSK